MANTPSRTKKTPVRSQKKVSPESSETVKEAAPAAVAPKSTESPAAKRKAPVGTRRTAAKKAAPVKKAGRNASAKGGTEPKSAQALDTSTVADQGKAAPVGEQPQVSPVAAAQAAVNAPEPVPVEEPAAAQAAVDTQSATVVEAEPVAPEPAVVAEAEPEPEVEVQAQEEDRTAAMEPPPAVAEEPPVHVEEPLPVDEPPPEVHYPPAQPNLFIVHITPEMAPVAKVGGLADVVFGITRELAIRGNHVEIILPKYDNLRYDHIWEMHQVFDDLWVPWYDGAIHCTVHFGFVHDRKCFFIEPHSGDNFFNRGSIYGFDDDVLRYAFFSRAAMEFMFKSGKNPDIIHCHDWQTALAPVYLYEIYQHLGMHHPRACFTIHNFKHQGLTGMETLRASGLHDPERYFDYNRLRDNHNPYALNLLKGGIVYSNFVTTVSPRYAFETKDQDQGFGLEPTLHTHHMKYGGVVNGIDYDVWNPEVDGHIPVQYGVESIEAKYDNKRALRQRLMLADNEKPIVAFIGRLDPQKGLELVRHSIFYSLERGAQYVLLGSSPDQAINNDFWGLKNMLNDSHDCHLEIGFDEDLSHLIYAGADMLVVPSRFEPCGLTQLISLRYGTVPVVREVGGLADTVFDKDHSYRPLHERNGYVFQNYDNPGLESALGRAISCYYDHPQDFRELMKNAMRSDYSWNHPGQDYLNIYDLIRNK